MTSEKKERDWVEQVGAPAYAAIEEMVAALQADYDRLEELRDIADDPETKYSEWEDREEYEELKEAAGDCESEDDARQRIDEDPLSLRIFGERTSGEWEATNYELLLGTGGPAVRIVGDLNDGEAASARLEVQDWFKPWTEYGPTDDDVLMAYVGCFYFGD
jgi:hypothetical protein